MTAIRDQNEIRHRPANPFPEGHLRTTNFVLLLLALGGCYRPYLPACGNGACEPGETAACADCAPPPVCGNGVCQTGEPASCPADCAGGPVCGNGVCETGEPGVCTDCASGPFCGDGDCSPGEMCAVDCGAGGPVCGNGTCEAGETAACADCAAPGWSCDLTWYGTNDGCDCGCSVPDPDCGGTGCTLSGCDAPACDYCWPGNGSCAGGVPEGADCTTANCLPGLLCVFDAGYDSVPRCATSCTIDPGCGETCFGGDTCVYLGTFSGLAYAACLPPRLEGAPCGCTFGSCEPGYLCYDPSGSSVDGYCYWQCLSGGDCYSDETCTDIGGAGACLLSDGSTPGSLCTDVCYEVGMTYGFTSLCDICTIAKPAFGAFCDANFPVLGGYVCRWLAGYLCDFIAEQLDCATYDCDWGCMQFGF